MKQTNNAIKFLMAQYRAIFNNAYFKGLATAALVTVAMSAGQAQAGTEFTTGDTYTSDSLAGITGKTPIVTTAKDDTLKNTAQKYINGITVAKDTALTASGSFISADNVTVNGTLTLEEGAQLILASKQTSDTQAPIYDKNLTVNSGGELDLKGNIGLANFNISEATITMASGGTNGTNLTAYGEGAYQDSGTPKNLSGKAVGNLTDVTATLGDSSNITSIGKLTVSEGTINLNGDVSDLKAKAYNLTYLEGSRNLDISKATLNVSGESNALSGKNITIDSAKLDLKDASSKLTIGTDYDVKKLASDTSSGNAIAGTIGIKDSTINLVASSELNFGAEGSAASVTFSGTNNITNKGTVNFYTPKISMSAADLNALVDSGKVAFKESSVANVAGDLDLTKKVLTTTGTLSTSFTLENDKTLKLASDGNVTLGSAFAVDKFTVEAGVLKLTPSSNDDKNFTQTSGSLIALNGLTSANETTLKDVIVSGSASAKTTLTLGKAGTTNGSVTKVDKITVKSAGTSANGILNIYGKWDLSATDLNVEASGAANLAKAADVSLKSLTVATTGALNITDGSLLTVSGAVKTEAEKVSLTDNSKLSVKYAEADKTSALGKVKLDGSSTLVLTGYEPAGGSIDLTKFGEIKSKFIGDTGLLKLDGVTINSGVAQNADVAYDKAQSGTGAAGVFDTNTVTGVTGNVAGSNDWGTVKLEAGQTELSVAANGAITLNGNGENKLVADSTGKNDVGVKLAADSILTVEATGTIKEVTAASDGQGKLIVGGNGTANTVTVTNDLGSTGEKLDTVNVIADSTLIVKKVYAKDLSVAGNLTATDVSLATLDLAGNATVNNLTLTGVSAVDGSLTVTQALSSADNIQVNGDLHADSLALTGSSKTVSVGQDGEDSKSGLLDVNTLNLGNGSLIIDPAYRDNASVGFVKGAFASQSDTDLEINVSGDVGVGQNAIFVAGMRSDDAAAQEIIARYTNAIGSLDKNGNNQIDNGEFGALFIANGQYTVASNTATIVDHTKTSAGFTTDFAGTTYNNKFTLGNNSALFVTEEFAQDLLNDNTNAVIKFAANDGVLALSNDSKIYIDTALTADDTLNLVTGTDASVTGATADTIEAANGLLQGNIASNGKVTFELVEATARAKLFNQSTPVQDLTVKALNGDFEKAETGVEYLLLAAQDNGGQASEATARLAVYGGSVQATNLAQQAATDAVVDRMSRANPNGSLVFANNAQGGGLWLSPVYKSHESDSFDADGMEYGVDGDLTGLVLGADSTTESGVRVGGYFNFGSADFDGQGIGEQVSSEADYFGFGLYAGMTFGQMSLVADAGFTQVSNDVEQNTGNAKYSKVTADVDSTAVTLGLRGEYKLNVAAMDVTPHLGVRYTRLAVDSYDAKSAGKVLATTDVDTMQMFSVPFGVTISKDIAAGSWTIKPVFDLTLTANAGDTDAKLDTTFIGATPVGLTSEAFDSFTYGATMGIDAKYGEKFSVGLNTNYVGSSNADEFSVMGNVRYMF